MKRIELCLLTVAAVALAPALLLHQARADDNDRFSFGDRERSAQGLRISPVPLKYNEHDRQLVGLGSYLVNASGGCNDCHSNPSYAPGGNPYLGQPKKFNIAHYLGGGQLFGPFISRNLTPENGLPAGRTYAQFLQIMRTGIDLDHQHPQISPLLQVMPWPLYQDMNERDIRAIYEYLRAIPPATPGTTPPATGQ